MGILKSDLGAQATWRGFSSQTLYIAYRLVLDSNGYGVLRFVLIKKNWWHLVCGAGLLGSGAKIARIIAPRLFGHRKISIRFLHLFLDQ